jgi:4-amino-4-deoxy-L-arabinose transferase-like glycosyltransferase
MNPVVLYFASGDSLYAGAVLLLLAVVISRYLKERQWLCLRNLAAWLGLALMVMACPPFSWTVDVIFLASFALWIVVRTSGSVGRELNGVLGRLRCCLLWS